MKDSFLIIPVLALQFVSCLFFLKGKVRISLGLLLLSGILIRTYFINIDPFLHDWDEKFHALVAKNLSHHFLIPTLIENPILPYDKCGWWGANHIWLHKQPLFLWQMAISIQLFGSNIYAVRLPSLIMSSLLIPIIFDMGKRVAGLRVGFISAFIFTCYEPILQLVSGLVGMEHNDIAFLFYVSLSIWAWIRFEESNKRRWIILMGIFVGGAILNKWVTGLMVLLSFGFYHLVFKNDFFSQSTIKSLLYALLTCALIVLPWQVFILLNYPQEAIFEYKYSSLHFSQVLEGHAQGTWFYFTNLKLQYKSLGLFIIVGIMYALLNFRLYKLILSAFVMVVCIFAFFTLAKTKLPSYTIVVTPILIIFLAIGVNIFLKWLDRFDASFFLHALMFLLFIVVFYDFSRVDEFYYNKTNWIGQMRSKKTQDLSEYRLYKNRLPPNSVVVRLPEFNSIEARFYTDFDCYGWVEDTDIIYLKKIGKKVFVHPEELDYIKTNCTVHLHER